MNTKGSLGFLGALFLLGAGLRLGSQSSPAGLNLPKPLAQILSAADPTPNDRNGPWWPACEFFRQEPSQRAKPADPDVDARWKCVPENENIRFLIATVPDPKRTHLALYFDRSIESIVAAAQASGYNLEQFWIPWSSQAEHDLPLLRDRERRKEDLERLYEKPGLLAFRRTSDDPFQPPALFVFLVGETPTTGVSEEALTAAAKAVNYIDPWGDRLPIAGPTYSGSLKVLCAALERMGKRDRVRLASGTVTQPGAKEMVEAHLGPRSYDSLVHNDQRSLAFFFQYVDGQWSKLDKSALISESGTAYGQETGNPVLSRQEHRLYMSYPREIARLRNAYQEEANQSGDKQAGVVAEGVKLTLKDGIEEPPHDRVEAFSPLQSPASQQAVLAAIANTLRREHVELSGIVATDILDSAFLDRYLRISAPDTRLFMLDADVLLSREVEPEPLTGLLSVTTYPLLSRGQHWMNTLTDNESRIQFSSLFEEGVYNSVRFLLYDKSGQGDVLRDYARPFGSAPQDARPPLWLTVLGRDGYWPVALLDQQCPDGDMQNNKCNPDPNSLPVASPEGSVKVEPGLHPESPSFAWYLSFWALVVWGMLHGLYWELVRRAPKEDSNAAKLNSWISGHVFPSFPENWPAHDSPNDNERPFLLSAILTICGAIVLFIAPGVRFAESFGGWTYVYAAFSFAVLVVLIRLAILFTLTRGGYEWIITGLAWLLATAFSAFWIAWCWMPGYDTGYFFAYRSLWLTTGVSPAIPMLLLIAAIYCGAWIHLKRQVQVNQRIEYEEYTIFRWRRELVQYNLAFLRQEFDCAVTIRERYTEKIVTALNDLGSPSLLVRAAVPFLSWIILFQPWRHAVSFEHWTYNWIYTLLLSAVFWTMSRTWAQFLHSWHEFKKFLEWLENQPVRRAFSRLQGKVLWVPLIARMPGHTLFISVRCQECLKALTSFSDPNLSLERANDLKALVEKLAPINRNIADSMESFQANPGDRAEYNHLQGEFEAARLWIAHDLRQHSWAKGSSESLESSSEPISKETKPPRGDEALKIIEEEFLALRTLMFMRDVYRQLRNLLGYVVTAFILFVISLNAYPFEAHRWIGVSSVLTFVALAAAVVYVFAQMDRDALLSRITKTKANELNKTFFLRTAQFTALPLLTLLASQFPSINRYIFFWAQPALEALR